MIIDDYCMDNDNITDKKILRLMLDILIKIKKNPDIDYGICSNFENHLGKLNLGFENYLELSQICKGILSTIWREWPKFSGEKNYPVPCPDGGCPIDAFSMINVYHGGYQIGWRWLGRYGRLRKELLNFTITSIRLALKEK